jgi:hypothetical protein
MSNTYELLKIYEYPVLRKFYSGDIESDTVDSLQDLALYEKKEDDTSASDIFDLMAKEDELCDIYDGLFDALSMTKADMIAQIKSTLSQLEDKNKEFCDKQTTAASYLPKD